jgi:hypothetical protein
MAYLFPHEYSEQAHFIVDISDVSESANEVPDFIYPSLAEDLFLFFIMFNITEAAMKYLLNMLSSHKIDVPKSVYLLKKLGQHQKNTETFRKLNVNKGSIAYLSIFDNLKFLVNGGFFTPVSDLTSMLITLRFNIDGLPIYKSSLVNLWPVLMTVEPCSYYKPLPIAIFSGIGKPDFSQLLTLLSEELLRLKAGLLVENFLFFSEKVLFICDAPAKSAVQGIKSHSGYFGCGYCQQKGEYFMDRVVFPEVDAELRSDENYALQRETNQVLASPLLESVPFFSGFPPDPMHLVFLGVTRRLFHYYFTAIPHLRLPCRVPPSQLGVLSCEINILKKQFTKEFNRSIRPIEELEHYKASEYRNFLLYAGPFLFKRFLHRSYYHHFLLLHFSMYVFSSDYCYVYFEHAKACVNRFVKQCRQLFGKQSLSYNFHCLSHLPHFISLYGTLDSFSCFPFENHLSILKRRLKSSRNLFQHSINTLLDIRQVFTSSSSSNLTFSTLAPNNCAILNSSQIILISNIHENQCVSGYQLMFKNDLYDYPYKSSFLMIGIYSQTATVLYGIPVKKCLVYPYEHDFVIIPLVKNEVFVK